jgi:hypothetical protein
LSSIFTFFVTSVLMPTAADVAAAVASTAAADAAQETFPARFAASAAILVVMVAPPTAKLEIRSVIGPSEERTRAPLSC